MDNETMKLISQEVALTKARNAVYVARAAWNRSRSKSDWDAYMDAILKYGRLRGPEFMQEVTSV